MAKKFNLAEFLPEAAVSDSDPARIVEIPLSKIIANGRNFYGVRDVEALADSIKLNGLLEPLIVYPYGTAGLYRLISGHRRIAALQMNKAESAPCRIVAKPASAAREDLMLISANGQRVKTGPEVAAEAQRMTDALLALKKEGAELPGRLRDMVAEALGVSSTALARKKVINEGLKVPGFRQAWESGKMGETVAYELAQLPSDKQYEALDQLIDAGVNYEKADIKTVQRIKRKVEAGESTTQDLAAEAEKRGIQCPEGDYSPLLAYLVRETLFGDNVLDYVRGADTKEHALKYLHAFGLSHDSTGGHSVNHDADPGGLTITSPIRRRLKWPEVWELIALDTMQRASAWLPEKEKSRAGGPSRTPAPTREPEDNGADEVYMAVSRVIDPDWMTGDPPGDGRYLCFARLGAFGHKEYTCERIGDAWWVFDAPAPATFEVLGWWPLPGGWKEAAK